MINQISFPRLNLSYTINRVAFNLFGKDIYWYAIIIAIGFVIAVLYALRCRKGTGITSDNILDLILWGLPVSIIFARAFYVLGDESVRSGGFLRIIAIWEGGIAIYGAIIGMILTGIVYSKAKKINMGVLFDLCAPAIMIGQIVGRWGNFVNAEVYGGVTESVFGMSINGSETVSPLFLYESVWMLIGFLVLNTYRKHKRADGEIFLLYILWYSIGRMIMEPLRDSVYVLRVGLVPISFAAAVIIALSAAAGLVYLYYKSAHTKNLKNSDAPKTETGNDE